MLKLGLPIVFLAFAVDQASKWVILNLVMVPPQVIPVTGFFNLVLGRNTGVSFGLFSDAPPWVLVAFTTAVVFGLLIWIQRADSRLTAVALGLIVGGALGNLVDRLQHGAVTDFLDFYLATHHWPAFNLADVGIVSGVGLLLLESLLPTDAARNRETDAKSIP